MLLNVPLRLMALLTLVVASGCSHLPSLSSINPFSSANPAVAFPSEVLVVESIPVSSYVTQRVTQPRVMPATGVEEVVETGIDSVADLRGALAQRLQDQNSSLSANYGAKAVTLGDTQGVLDLPPSYWAVQIAAVKNIEQVAKMVKDNRLEGMLGVPMNTQAGPLHAVLTGVFVKREDAQASAENLPPALAGYQPWVRPLAHLQAAMR